MSINQVCDFTALVGIPFSCAWAGDQHSFSKKTSLFDFKFPKWFFLSDMVYSERNGNGAISHYFTYQTAKLFAGNKILN